MATPEARARYIRFQLETLSERNGHHEFEHIGRRVAAARIASNLLPATGPVSGGGDQGRDFETHPTELVRELGPAGGFVALTAADPLAFVCTIQRTQLRKKLVGDVAKVVASGAPVARVHAFIVAGMSKSQREKAIKAARNEHSVELVVHDALYLAEQLAESDLYWVAERYLDAPKEMAPDPPAPEDDGLPQWYRTDRERRRATDPVPTPGEVLDLADGLRHATFHESARADLPFWLDLMRPLADPGNAPVVRQRARYEVAVAVLRGQGSLRPADDLVEAYFSEAENEDDADRLQEASTLLMYTVGAKARAQTALDAHELAAIGDRLRGRVAELLESTPPSNRRARLLAALGHLNIHLDPLQLVIPDAPVEIPDPALGIEENDELTVEPGTEMLPPELAVDVDAAVSAWMELARELERAPLYPVDDLASVLGALAPLLIDHVDWEELNQRVDRELANQAGQAAVAARARDRAFALLKADRVKEAIQEFHRAQVDWWTGDTLRGAMLASMLLWDCYSRLELHHAAEQSALTVAFVAASEGMESVQDLLPAALASAALSEYRVGLWIGASELTEAALLTSNALLEGGVDLEDPRVETLLVHAGMTAAAAQVMVPCALEAVQTAQARFHLHELLGADPLTIDGAPDTMDEWDRRASEQLSGNPFADLAPEYILRFSGLGLRFVIRADPTDRVATRAADRLAAAAQVLLVELAGEDLCLVPSEIDMTVVLAEDPDASVADRISTKRGSSGRAFRFALTGIEHPVDDPGAIGHELLSVLTVALVDASLLEFSVYEEALNRAFARGLTEKILFGRPYDELRLAFEDPKLRESLPEGCKRPPPSLVAASCQSDQLPWRDGAGPTFTPVDAEGNAAARYRKTTSRLPRQLAALREDPGFADVVSELRARGWLDHHILTSVMNITINERFTELGIDPWEQSVTSRIVEEPEGDIASTLSPQLYTIDAMEEARRYALPAVLKTWGLTLHSPFPDLEAVERVLEQRYAYWTADAQHDKVLPEP